MRAVSDSGAEDRRRLLETEIERRLAERFAALRDEFDRLRLETDRRWFGFLEKFDQDLKGVVPKELVAGEAGEKAVSAPGGVSVETARALDQAATQVDVLHRFLEECRRHCSRAALLVARGGAVGAWKAVGFSAHGGDDEAVRHSSLPLSENGVLSRVMAGSAIRLSPSNEISPRLRATGIADAVLIPMVVREKVSGALYADAVVGEERRFDPDSLGLLTFLAGLIVDRLASRKLKPAPALRPPEGAKTAEPASMWMNEGVGAAEPAPAGVAGSYQAEPAAAVPSEEEQRIEVDPSFRLSGSAASAPAAAPPVPHEASSARRLGGPLAESSGDERRDEARRFARLLVSEIKLYNERAVLEGRENGNLYARLREDIDRSRQMYNERIPEDVRAATNFFQEELVSILADGRPEVLGL